MSFKDFTQLTRFLTIATILFLLSACSPEIDLLDDQATLYAGQEFDAIDYIVDELKSNKDIEIKNIPDTSTPGTYEVTYLLGNSEKTLVLTVKDEPITLVETSVNLEIGSDINPLDYISSEDLKNKLSITNNVDSSTEGSYEINYEFDGVSKSLIVNVSKVYLIPKIEKIIVDLGSLFDPMQYVESNFPNSDNITISDNVNTSAAGTYKVVYTLYDTKTEIPVVVKDVSPILTKTKVALAYNSKFDPIDYLVDTDKNNSSIIISNDVNTNVPGTYKVIYSLGSVSKVLEVLVKEEVVVAKNKIEVVSITSPISAGSNANIKIKGTPNTLYSITVHYKSGPSTADGLNSKNSDGEGIVEWTWKVGTRTSSGSWKISISSSVDSITTYFTVY